MILPHCSPIGLFCLVAISLASARALAGQEPPARPAYLSRLEFEIVREHNLARTQPARYADFLEERRDRFRGRLLERPGMITLQTVEGVSAVDEAIRFLKDVDPIATLQPSEGMSRGARDHVDDQGPRGERSHTGSDGSRAGARVNRYGRWVGIVAENITFGPSTAREIVIQLIIDDGISDRGHRSNIFMESFRFVGAACGEHAESETMCVMTYARDYVEAAPGP